MNPWLIAALAMLPVGYAVLSLVVLRQRRGLARVEGSPEAIQPRSSRAPEQTLASAISYAPQPFRTGRTFSLEEHPPRDSAHDRERHRWPPPGSAPPAPGTAAAIALGQALDLADRHDLPPLVSSTSELRKLLQDEAAEARALAYSEGRGSFGTSERGEGTP